MSKKRPVFVYKLMIVAATLIWGASFVVMKDAVGVMEPSWLIGIRFLLTAAILSVVFFKRMRMSLDRVALIGGAVLGVLIFAAYWFQTVGLVYTTPGKNAFLTAIYCVLVPFVYWIVAKRKPSIYNVCAAVICITGVGFVSLANDAFSMGFGDAMTLVGGCAFSIHIVATAHFSKSSDVLVLTVLQFWSSGILGIIVGAFTEPFPNIAAIDGDFLFNMFYLIVFASCVAMGFQNAAVARVAPSQAAILLSLESVFGVIFSVVFYGEELTVSLIIGFVLIFVSIILSEAFPIKRPPKSVDKAISEDTAAME